MSERFDIAIVGGGLAGASLAVALAPLGYKIVVIEAVAFKAADQPSYDDRTLALSHSSCRIRRRNHRRRHYRHRHHRCLSC